MPNPTLSLVHPTSNPFARNAALALADQGWLREIITTTAYHPQGRLAQGLKGLPIESYQKTSWEVKYVGTLLGTGSASLLNSLKTLSCKDFNDSG